MKIVATIAEYNPLHSGHIYHIERTRSELNPDLFVVVMSGNFCERGDIAIKEKHCRAKWAIESGADIVLELPYVYAVNCAEIFAKGALKTLSTFNEKMNISFGSECGDIYKLKEIATIDLDDETRAEFKSNLKNGMAYPKALSLATNNCDLSPNNTLGIEYIRAAKKYNFDTYTLKRENNYNSEDISGKYASATAIRNYIKNNKISDILEFLPSYVLKSINNCTFNNNLSDAILYKLSTIKTSDLKNISEVTEGLENRIKEMAKISCTYEELINNIKTKRYTMAKIKRILLNVLCELDVLTRDELLNTQPYARVLAIDAKRSDVLPMLKNSNLIIKSSDVCALPDDVQRSIEFENRVDSIFSAISKTPFSFNTIFVNK